MRQRKGPFGRGRFQLDRANGKLLGVCAGISNHIGLDVTLVRAALVVATLMGAWPWSVIAYAVAAFVGRNRGSDERQSRFGADEARDRMRSLDLRMQAIETHAVGSNSQLAREIESLR